MNLLRHLLYFITVAEEGHFGHAANRLGMTQPPLSKGVLRLEQRLGVTLLSRGTRGVQLTPAGVELLPRARALLENAEEFEEAAERQREYRGALRIGLIPQLSDRSVAAVVRAVRHAGVPGQPGQPGPAEPAEPAEPAGPAGPAGPHGGPGEADGEQARSVITTIGPTVELADAVAAGRLDCAVVHHPALVHALECGPVLKLRRWLLVPSDHPVARATAPAVRSLTGLPFALAPRAHGTAAYDLFVDTLRGRGLDPRFLPAVSDRETVAAVAAGRAFGLTADGSLHAPGVTRLALQDDGIGLRVRLVWRDPGPSAAVRAAVESALREQYEQGSGE